MRNYDFEVPGLETQAAPTASNKHSVSMDGLVKLAAALISTGQIFYGWMNRNPLNGKIFMGIGAIILLWIVRPYVFGVFRALSRRIGDRRLVKREDPLLRGLVSRFDRFTSSNDSRALMAIVRSTTSRNTEAVSRIVACDYLGDWLVCFKLRLALPVKSLESFLLRCHEFSVIVNSFNRNYVLRSHEAFERAGAPLDEYHVHQLEEFREEYTAFLREFEQWAGELNTAAQPRWRGMGNFFQVSPCSSFERVKTFRNAKGAGSVS
jgi:hypothetical protein